MNDCRKLLEAALQATVISSPTTFSWFGQRSPQLSWRIRQALTPDTARGYLVFNLKLRLYSDFYCHGFAAPLEPQVAETTAGWTPFVEALSAANMGSGCWEDGWEILATNGDRVRVRGREIELLAHPTAYQVAPGGTITTGGSLRVRLPKEYLSMSPGYYTAVSDTPFIEDGSQPLVRFYWHLTAETAVRFIREATTQLNQACLPFRLKVLRDPTSYIRCDAGVIYIHKHDYERAARLLEQIYPGVADGLRQAIPLFTKRLAPGLGLAEDPHLPDSFGFQRCGILADGMVRAYERGARSIAERLRIVEERFLEAGISLEAPFLNANSHDTYTFQLPSQFHPHPLSDAAPAASVAADPEVFLKAAAEIGQRLARAAIWQADRCNWLGAEPTLSEQDSNYAGVVYRPLGRDIYNGTSGVALFLAELYAATGISEVRRTALGAIRQALWRTDEVAFLNHLGLYTGREGIALAAARVGIVLGEETLPEHARKLVGRATADALEEPYEWDLLSGVAGAIAGLVILHCILGDPSLLNAAASLGDALIQAADRSDDGYSWKSKRFPHQRNLTGFSRGAAGIGYALLELFQATGDAQYLMAARHAFQYERSWFDSQVGNWPDFRGAPTRGKQTRRPLVFATYWCQGAPGIALSRLHAYQMLKEEAYRDEAITALQTTQAALDATLDSGSSNFSLCHGIAGNAEALCYGHQTLGEEWAKAKALAVEAAHAGIARHGQGRGATWPCGTGGETPSLMLGLAGIGYFYLRLYNPAVPSILMPQGIHYLTADAGASRLARSEPRR